MHQPGNFKVPLKPEDSKLYLNKVMYPLCHVFPDLALYQNALDVMEQTHYSFNDSLILAGALQGGCGLLYSEDFASRAANRFADHSEPV